MKVLKKSFKEKCSGDVDVEMRDFKKSTKYKTVKAKITFFYFPPVKIFFLRNGVI